MINLPLHPLQNAQIYYIFRLFNWDFNNRLPPKNKPMSMLYPQIPPNSPSSIPLDNHLQKLLRKINYNNRINYRRILKQCNL